MEKWSDNQVRQVLREGNEKARKVADDNLKEIKRTLKLYV